MCLLTPPAQFLPVHSPSFAFQLRKQLTSLCKKIGPFTTLLEYLFKLQLICAAHGLYKPLGRGKGEKQQHVFTNFQLIGMWAVFYLSFVMEIVAFGDPTLFRCGLPATQFDHSATVGLLIVTAANLKQSSHINLIQMFNQCCTTEGRGRWEPRKLPFLPHLVGYRNSWHCRKKTQMHLWDGGSDFSVSQLQNFRPTLFSSTRFIINK